MKRMLRICSAYKSGYATLIAICLFPLIAGASSKPNVVVFYSDAPGYSDVGCYGSEIRTPNIDNLAKHGVRFENFRFNRTLSGMALEPILLKNLNGNGYVAYHAGTWQGGSDSDFNYVADRAFASRPAMPTDMMCRVMENTFSATAVQVEKMISYHFRNSIDTGLFLYVDFSKLRDSYKKTPRGAIRYRTLKRTYANSSKVIESDRLDKLTSRGLSAPDLKIDSLGALKNNPESMAGFASSVEATDRAIGNIVSAIPADQKDNTIFIFLTGNGAGKKSIDFNSPFQTAMNRGRSEKVPCIISWANGIESVPVANKGWGKVVKKSRVDATDISSTLIAATSDDQIAAVEGRDLIAVLGGQIKNRSLSIQDCFTDDLKYVTADNDVFSRSWKTEW